TPYFYPLSLHDALPISPARTLHLRPQPILVDPIGCDRRLTRFLQEVRCAQGRFAARHLERGELLEEALPVSLHAIESHRCGARRSEEHTSELQSRGHLV